jgi:hypothetical protein
MNLDRCKTVENVRNVSSGSEIVASLLVVTFVLGYRTGYSSLFYIGTSAPMPPLLTKYTLDIFGA